MGLPTFLICLLSLSACLFCASSFSRFASILLFSSLFCFLFSCLIQYDVSLNSAGKIFSINSNSSKNLFRMFSVSSIRTSGVELRIFCSTAQSNLSSLFVFASLNILHASLSSLCYVCGSRFLSPLSSVIPSNASFSWVVLSIL